ncbi:F0F1 ATP synthase subunit A [candidate division KSB1 bacterium]|nr:F0F1 ATP synthase subunit A [candidate division KSB1 bacterium]
MGEHQGAEHVAEHGEAGADFIIHHILAQPLIKLPTIFGVDFTITNHVLMMWIAAAILIVTFGLAFRRRPAVPSGLANALEGLVVYLRDDIILPNLGHEAKAYAPYLLTAFFFVLLCNLLGLVPYGATATGNIAVTGALAICTFMMVQIAGIRKHGLLGYLKHFCPPGMPFLLRFILVPVELISMVTKHFALAIRLFANMIAGHITILALMSLIFFFKNWLITPFPLAIILFSSLLEILIALIQAYVFTILSAVFIGASIAEEH